jgi:hypothetical protein
MRADRVRGLRRIPTSGGRALLPCAQKAKCFTRLRLQRRATGASETVGIGYRGDRQLCASPDTIWGTFIGFWRLAFAGIQHGRFLAVQSALLIAVSLIPVLLAIGLGHLPAVPRSASSVTGTARPRRPERATLRPLTSQDVLSSLNPLTDGAPPYSIEFNWCLAASSIGAAISGSTIPCAVSVQQDMLEWDR